MRRATTADVARLSAQVGIIWQEVLRMIEAKQRELLAREDDPDPDDVLNEIAKDIRERLPR